MSKRPSRLPPIHPGEILREEFLKPLGMSAHQLSVALRVPATRINEIVNAKRGITAATALRLSRYFGTTPRFWLNMQASYELEMAVDRFGEASSERCCRGARKIARKFSYGGNHGCDQDPRTNHRQRLAAQKQNCGGQGQLQSCTDDS